MYTPFNKHFTSSQMENHLPNLGGGGLVWWEGRLPNTWWHRWIFRLAMLDYQKRRGGGWPKQRFHSCFNPNVLKPASTKSWHLRKLPGAMRTATCFKTTDTLIGCSGVWDPLQELWYHPGDWDPDCIPNKKMYIESWDSVGMLLMDKIRLSRL